MADKSFDELIARAKRLPGFADTRAPEREAAINDRFATMDKEARDFKPVPRFDADAMLGGNPTLNNAIKVAQAVKMATRGPDNAPWYIPSLSAVGEGEILGGALGLAGKYIGKPIARGVGKAFGAADDFFGGAASRAAKAAPKPSAAPGLSDVIRPGSEGWVPPSEPVRPTQVRPSKGGFVPESGVPNPTPSRAAADFESEFHLPYNTPYVERARSAVRGIGRASAKQGGDHAIADPLRMSLDEEQQLSDLLPGLREKVEALKPAHESWASRPGDLTTGSVFRQAGDALPERGILPPSTPNLPSTMSGPGPKAILRRQSPMEALTNHEAGDVLSLPRSRFTQGLGRGLEREPINGGPRPDFGGGKKPFTSTKGMFSEGEEEGIRRLGENMQNVHGDQHLFPNGGEEEGLSGGGFRKLADLLKAAGHEIPNMPGEVKLQSPMSALAAHESGDVLSLPRSKFTQGIGRGLEKPRPSGTVIRESPMDALGRETAEGTSKKGNAIKSNETEKRRVIRGGVNVGDSGSPGKRAPHSFELVEKLKKYGKSRKKP